MNGVIEALIAANLASPKCEGHAKASNTYLL